jgi:hypothetical protein
MVVMGVLAHRPLQEVDLAAMPLQLLQQHHLVHVVAGQPVGGGDEHAVQRRCRHRVAQPVQTRPLQARATVAVVAEDVLLPQVPPLPDMSRHLRWAGALTVVQCSHASACRAVPDACVHANPLHGPPPASLLGSSASPVHPPHQWPPTPGSPDTRGPSVAARLEGRTSAGECAIAVSSLPPW